MTQTIKKNKKNIKYLFVYIVYYNTSNLCNLPVLNIKTQPDSNN